MADSSQNDADLRWFFSLGQSALERSPFGGILERQLNYTQGSNGEKIRHPKEQEDNIWEWERRWCAMTQACVDGVRIDLSDEPWMQALRDDDPDPSLTAKPSTAIQATTPIMPDEAVIHKHARISNALRQIGVTDLAVLQRWYGDRGAYWCVKGSQVYVLLPLTRGGRKLLDTLSERLGDERPDEILAQQSREQEAWTDIRRGALLRSAHDEAIRMIAKARSEYRKALT